MENFTGFTKDHIGEVVTDITLGTGKIVCFTEERDYPVQVRINDRSIVSYTKDGRVHSMDVFRSLYFGHNIKVEVTGEEIPEPKLICPVCGVEHEVRQWRNTAHGYNFDIAKCECPLYFASFPTKDDAKQTMKNLIRAMEK